jgi:multisubunit Na+/H+ antiporter MnhB subunit
MNKAISVALLAVGVILIVFGINASQSFSSDVSRLFTGSPTDRTIWFFVGGGVALAVGLVMLFQRSRSID